MDVAVDHADGHPESLVDEEHLARGVPGGVDGQADHAQFCLERGTGLVPGEVRLRGVWFGEALHAVEGAAVQG